MSKSHIPVFVCSDENYAPFVSTTALSMSEHTSDVIDLYVIDCGIKEETRRKVEEIKKAHGNLGITWIDFSVEDCFHDFKVLGHISRAAYARFLIPLLRPELDKAIYSDIDVIYCGDISELYAQKLNGYSLGAVPGHDRKNTTKLLSSKERLGLSKDHIYFESGLLLIDCKQWREKQICIDLLRMEPKIREKLLYVDQDILNCYFECNYYQLDDKFSVTSPKVKKFINNCGELNGCVMRHFEGRRKPWLVHPLRPELRKSNLVGKNLFWHYAKISPFYDELLERFPLYKKVRSLNPFK